MAKLLLSVILLAVCSVGQAKAAIAPGADCGIGAAVVGTKNAGKVTIGVSPDQNTCLLSGFSWPGGKVPSCSAILESGTDAQSLPIIPQPYATISAATTVTLVYPPSASDDMQPGYVISYLCVGQ